jgi:methionyl-tRNA formyltransferase
MVYCSLIRRETSQKVNLFNAIMKPQIIFFGTHEFAQIILEELLNSDSVEIKAVVTQPDKLIGRKQILEAPPVKKFLDEKNFNTQILQPASLKNEGVEVQIASHNADLFVLVEYGKLIPKTILDLPPKGTLNVHPSMLPQYRGPSPIQQALLDGQSKTGTSIMLLDEEMDHGPILAQKELEIEQDDTFPTLRQKLAHMSSKLLVEALKGYMLGEIRPKEQDHSKATFCKILKRENGHIDWSNNAQKIYNLWRGLVPWPGVFTELQKDGNPLRLKILQLATTDKACTKTPGTFIVEDKKLFINTKDNLLEILELQLEGKKSLSASEFIIGHSFLLDT